MQFFNILQSEGSFLIAVDGAYAFLQMNGIPFGLGQLAAGWTPVVGFRAGNLFICVIAKPKDSSSEWEHTSWFFNLELEFLANRLEDVDDQLLRSAAEDLFLGATIRTSEGSYWPGKAEIKKWGLLHVVFRIFMEASSGIVAERFHSVDINSDTPVKETPAWVMDLFSRNAIQLQNRIALSDGAELTAKLGKNCGRVRFAHSYILDETRIMYLSFDSNGILQAAAVFGGFHFAPILLWSVTDGSCYFHGDDCGDATSALVAAVVNLFVLRAHVRMFNEYRLPKVVVPVLISHLGHHLVNELSGMERFALLASGATRDDMLIAVVENGEPFGELEEIFPTLKGLIGRFSSFEELQSQALREEWFLVRFTGNYISAKLSERIKEVSDRITISIDSDLIDLCNRRSTQEYFVVIGLRVENRTWTNQLEGIIACIEYLATINEQLTIFIDGHNSSLRNSKEIFRSFSANQNRHGEPIDFELRIFSAVEEHFAEHERVRVISLIGITVPENIYALKRCDYFFCPWGAGLAKYRWVANLPGVVITSQYNLRHRADLQIYDEGGLREGASRLIYAPESCVKDRPDAEVLINNWNHPSFQNFEVIDFQPLKELLASTNEACRKTQRRTDGVTN